MVAAISWHNVRTFSQPIYLKAGRQRKKGKEGRGGGGAEENTELEAKDEELKCGLGTVFIRLDIL